MDVSLKIIRIFYKDVLRRFQAVGVMVTICVAMPFAPVSKGPPKLKTVNVIIANKNVLINAG